MRPFPTPNFAYSVIFLLAFRIVYDSSLYTAIFHITIIFIRVFLIIMFYVCAKICFFFHFEKHLLSLFYSTVILAYFLHFVLILAIIAMLFEKHSICTCIPFTFIPSFYFWCCLRSIYLQLPEFEIVCKHFW